MKDNFYKNNREYVLILAGGKALAYGQLAHQKNQSNFWIYIQKI